MRVQTIVDGSQRWLRSLTSQAGLGSACVTRLDASTTAIRRAVMAFTSPYDLFFLSRITESRPSYLSTSTTEVRLRGASSPHPGVKSVAERNITTTSYVPSGGFEFGHAAQILLQRDEPGHAAQAFSALFLGKIRTWTYPAQILLQRVSNPGFPRSPRSNPP